MDIPKIVSQALSRLPKTPGVYLFLNEKEEYLYIGKAKVLKNRVKSYFQKSAKHAAKTKKMLEKVANIRWIESESESDALLLESNLVHEHQPKFNVLLRDDKHFLYVKITKESFPNVSFSREMKRDGSEYFGPFTSAKKIRNLVDYLREVLQFRMCRVGISPEGMVLANPEQRKIPCLDAQIHRCSAPCYEQISSEKYQEQIVKLRDFLRGNDRSLSKSVEEKMHQAAEEKSFEKAARFRDLLQNIQSFAERKVASLPLDFSANVIGFCPGKSKSFVQVFVVREGKILHSNPFSLETASDDLETFTAFFRDYLQKIADIPPLFLVPAFFPEEDRQVFSDLLETLSGKKVEVRIPQKGAGRKLLELAEKNAKVQAANSRASFENIDVLEKLQESLGLKKRPERIECYDISHLSGTHSVGSRVVFLKGKPAKSEYRHYKMRSLPEGKIDDFAAMGELLSRRLKRLKSEEGILATEEVTSEKEIEDIEKKMKQEGLPTFTSSDQSFRQFHFLQKKTGKSVGYARVKQHGKLFELGGTLVEKDFRHQGMGTEILRMLVLESEHSLLRLIIKKKKHLRWFVSLKSLGFSEEKKPPKSFLKPMGERQKEDGHERVCMKISPKDLQLAAQKMPDLLVIDGGKGQLSAVVSVLKKQNLFESIALCSLAKREEEIFLPEQKQPLCIPKTDPENELLQRIRDEAHRFAISYNRNLRKKAETRSVLDDIPDLGSVQRKKLLKHFGSPRQILSASLEDLEKIVSKKVAENICAFEKKS